METQFETEKTAWVTDLKLIEKLANEKAAINHQFAQVLKTKESQVLDRIVSELSRSVARGIDCKACANCCQSLTVAPNYPDIAQLACANGLETNEFKNEYMKRNSQNEWVFRQRPCPMLKNKLCSVYESRPSTCRTYPHLEKGHFIGRIGNVLSNLKVCPIAFNTFELLKLQFE